MTITMSITINHFFEIEKGLDIPGIYCAFLHSIKLIRGNDMDYIYFYSTLLEGC